MASPDHVDWLIVGLGNPGARYADTRHNIGWMVCEKLVPADEWRQGGRLWMEARLRVGRHKLLLVEPLTYMNLSGEAVKALAANLKIGTDRIVAVVDEYNFPVGKVHLKRGGSDGGHNGIASLIDELGKADFYRLRCGIGRDFGPGGLVDYVLAPFGAEQTAERDAMIDRAGMALKHLARIGAGRAMSDINSGALWAPPKKARPETPGQTQADLKKNADTRPADKQTPANGSEPEISSEPDQ